MLGRQVLIQCPFAERYRVTLIKLVKTEFCPESLYRFSQCVLGIYNTPVGELLSLLGCFFQHRRAGHCLSSILLLISWSGDEWRNRMSCRRAIKTSSCSSDGGGTPMS